MSRAGLNIIYFLCFLAFIGFVLPSPIPERLSHSLARHTGKELTNELLARSFETLLVDRELDSEDRNYLKRDYLSLLEGCDITPSKNEGPTNPNLQRRSVFSKLKHAVKRAANKIKKGVKKVGKGFQKAAHYLKENGAKIGKFGLKILAATASAAGRLTKFIPGVGTAVSMALKGVAMGANIASDKIHVHLGGALGKIAGGLNYVISPMGAASKKLGGASVAANLFGREYF
ncbi:hypothetical protein CPB84DRAFT_1850216 [Gymnopilus junonius]|uniref:Uncharacterized protein n=1 Tax=Gymnopilus junonius TaxID=109634 RepID=A0A9P5TKJ9_GYMJU|nr:hypothetical protein CPB84DRAFT_1850216 [Gymnopilus junonius]